MKKLMQLLRDNSAKDRAPLQLVRSEADAKHARLYIYDVIDDYWGVSAKEVAEAIQGLGADTTLHLHINSPGGDVFAGRAMASAIAAHPGQTIAHIDGLAASAATTVALAAKRVEISDGGFFMIHNAWSIVWGNRHDMRETAGLLEKIDGVLAAEYSHRSGQKREDVAQWMDDETWFTAQEALEKGFVHAIAGAAEDDAAAASNRAGKSWNLGAFGNAPKALTEPRPPAESSLQEQTLQQRQRNERRLALFTAS